MTNSYIIFSVYRFVKKYVQLRKNYKPLVTN